MAKPKAKPETPETPETPAPVVHYEVTVWAIDDRPEKPENFKELERPDSGWRTKSGEKKIGTGVKIDTDSGAVALEQAATMAGTLPEGRAEQIARVEIRRVETAAAVASDNPFGSLAG